VWIVGLTKNLHVGEAEHIYWLLSEIVMDVDMNTRKC